MAPPVGPAGVISCSGDAEPSRATDAGVRSGLGISRSRTDLSFDRAPDAAMTRDAVVTTFDLRLSRKSSFQLGAGGTPGGSLSLAGETHSIGPGWLLFGSFTYRLLDGQGRGPFLLGTVSLG